MREVVYNDKEWTYEVRDVGRVMSEPDIITTFIHVCNVTTLQIKSES